jgi:hypothetical protein
VTATVLDALETRRSSLREMVRVSILTLDVAIPMQAEGGPGEHADQREIAAETRGILASVQVSIPA